MIVVIIVDETTRFDQGKEYVIEVDILSNCAPAAVGLRDEVTSGIVVEDPGCGTGYFLYPLSRAVVRVLGDAGNRDELIREIVDIGAVGLCRDVAVCVVPEVRGR